MKCGSSGYREDISSIDIMKFFMSICVVAIHTRPFVEIDNEIFQDFYEVIVRIAVPFFFISSGYLLFGKLKYPYCNTQSLKKVKSSIIRTLKIYCIWTFVYMPITIYDYCTNGKSIVDNIKHFSQGLFFLGEHLNSWPLWYLLSAFYGLGIIYVLLKRKMNPKHVFVCSFVLYILGDVLDLLVSYKDIMPKWIDIVLQIYIDTFLKGRITQGVFFISCGMMLCTMKIRLTKMYYYLFVLGCVIYSFFEMNIMKSLGLALYSNLFFIILLNWGGERTFRYGEYFRIASKVIYFTHMIFYTIYVMIAYRKTESYGMDVFLATLFLSIGTSIIYIIYKKQFFKVL